MSVKITIRAIDAMRPGEIIYDSTVTGFGARRQRSARVTYFLTYRTAQGRSRWFTIGKHGSPFTPDSARREALRLLNEVVQGGDPSATKSASRHAMTVTELCERYMADATSGRLLTRAGRRPKRASTLAKDRIRINAHVGPRLGRLAVGAVTRRDIEDVMHAVGGAAGTRTINMLGAIFNYAIRENLTQVNPCTGIIKPAGRRRTRRLSDAEYAHLGRWLGLGETARTQAVRTDSWPGPAQGRPKEWPPAMAVVRLLAVTGWRSGEVLGLKWSEVSLETRTAHLGDTKTGASMRPLSLAACAIVRDMEPFRSLSPDGLVFPAERTSRSMAAAFRKVWETRIGLPKDVTPHTLRHSFASLAGDLGFSEVVIAALLGHRLGSMTSRYIHSADAVLLAAADRVAEETLRRMAFEV